MAVVRHYVFNDNAASTTLVATVGTNGALTGGDNTSAKAAAGPGGTITASLDLNGTDDGLGIQEIERDAVAFTYSGWVYPDSLTNLVFFGRAASQFRKLQATTSTNVLFATSLDDYNFTVPAFSTATWYHIFLTGTAGGTFRLWINGTESTTGSVAGGGITTTNVIGRSNTVYANARFAQWRIFDTDESANVATYYAEGVSAGGRTTKNTRSHPLGIGSGINWRVTV